MIGSAKLTCVLVSFNQDPNPSPPFHLGLVPQMYLPVGHKHTHVVEVVMQQNLGCVWTGHSSDPQQWGIFLKAVRQSKWLTNYGWRDTGCLIQAWRAIGQHHDSSMNNYYKILTEMQHFSNIRQEVQGHWLGGYIINGITCFLASQWPAVFWDFFI